MHILAIETTGIVGTVAFLADARVLSEMPLDAASRSAQSLAPAIAELLRERTIPFSEIELIAAATGPGSFTGLRVGVTTAKTLAFALSCPAIGIDALDAIAAQADVPEVSQFDDSELHAVMDAQRGDFALARFARESERAWRRLGPNRLIAADVWLSQLSPGTRVTGPVLKRIAERIPTGVQIEDAGHWQPRAATVGKLAYAAWKSGRRDDPLELSPNYIRPSYANEPKR